MPEDEQILDVFREKKKIIIINKTDIVKASNVVKIKEQLRDITEQAPVVASVINGVGIDDLIKEIEELFLKGTVNQNNEVLLSNVRHRQLIDSAIESLSSAEAAHEGGLPLDFVTIDIKESAEYLGKITGESIRNNFV